MIDLTKSIPMRGFLQDGSSYNVERARSETKLIVERRNVGFSKWYTCYVKKSFLGLVQYWSFVGWWGSDANCEAKIAEFMSE